MIEIESYLMKRDKEDLKNYHKIFNQDKLGIRFSPRERALLENWMRRDGWENMSGFIKYRLFGFEPDRKLEKQIKEGTHEDVVTLLREEIKELARRYTYVYDRYNKDMGVLYIEPGVDVKQWAAVTNHWHAELVKQTNKMMDVFIMIAKNLGISERVVPPFREPNEKKYDDMTTKEKYESNEKLRQELLLLGRDIIED